MNMYWDKKTSKYVENEAVDKFLKEIEEVCKKHNFSISHEDGHGGFIIEKYKEDNIDWLNGASLNVK
jgi:hypothetical protein